MIITDNYIRSVGKYKNKGRYYSSTQNCYYIGTVPNTDLAYFSTDVKPREGDYLLDYSTNTGYLVGTVLAAPEAGNFLYYEAVLITVNNSASIFRHVTLNGLDRPTFKEVR